MLEAAGDKGLNTIYYLDMTKERDTFEYENNELVRSIEGTDAYFTMLQKLDGYLKPYIIYDENGNGYDTQEKRIQLPFLLAVKDGEVVSAQLAVYELEENQSKYDEITEDQHDELYKLFCSMYTSLQ